MIDWPHLNNFNDILKGKISKILNYINNYNSQVMEKLSDLLSKTTIYRLIILIVIIWMNINIFVIAIVYILRGDFYLIHYHIEFFYINQCDK